MSSLATVTAKDAMERAYRHLLSEITYTTILQRAIWSIASPFLSGKNIFDDKFTDGIVFIVAEIYRIFSIIETALYHRNGQVRSVVFKRHHLYRLK